ncbi:MAG: aminotransferase class I/II-fold pyridoxal phosphate-dependent enzyme, partial [Gammaproteobacteria bacterium]
MASDKLETLFQQRVEELNRSGSRKGFERVITGVKPAADDFGPRFMLDGYGDRPFLRMNGNAYLGLNHDPRVITAEEDAGRRFGTGPGAVRFISGTYLPHVELEQRLAAFHGREACMLFSAAYSAMMGVLPQLIGEETLVVSDALNHNCIINAIRLAQPARKAVYPHLDMAALEVILESNRGRAKRVIAVSDGIFSMRGDHAPLNLISEICRRYEDDYPEGIVTVVDDSHGVGAFGATGRGTEEQTAARADVLIATLGKALGVNGGYVVASRRLIDYLRESAPSYIYSNPITPGEAAAALKALEILDSQEGIVLVDKIRELASALRTGFRSKGYETLPGEHPIVPLMVRNTEKTKALVERLFEHNILATGLAYPVVPRGDEEIRFQINAA